MRNRYILVLDLPAIAVASIAAFVLRFGWWFFQYRLEAPLYVAAALLLKPPMFHLFGLYRRYWRYVSLDDLRAVVLAVGASTVIMAIFVGLALPAGLMQAFARSVIVMDGVLTFMLVAGIRVSVRVVAESRTRSRDISIHPTGGHRSARRGVLIVGAGDAGAMVVREMQRNPQLNMQPVGFLDDDVAKHGKQIYGLPVLGNTHRLAHVIRAGMRGSRIDEVVIAMPRAAGQTVRRIVETCQALKIASRTMPGVFELLDGKVSVSRLRHVEITDLLRRPQVVSESDTSRYVTGRVVLVTGAGGSIGSELCRQVAHLGPAHLVMLGHGENSLFEAGGQLREEFPQLPLKLAIGDIRDRRRLEQLFAEFRPDVVFHAAAHKHVHLMEENVEEAITNNVVGTLNVVNASLEAGTRRFVGISTDKAVSPGGIMGASKAMSSLIVREIGRRTGRCFVTVRFGNVLGSRGSIVPVLKHQIERGGPVTITHPDMKRFFMTIPEAVHLVLQAGGIGSAGESFVLKMGNPVRIMDLAEDLIRLSGFTPDQIAIAVTGMRPGEKLEESLWESEAVVEPTAHPDILKVTEPLPEIDDVDAVVNALADAAAARDRFRIAAILCERIPTFTPSIEGIAPIGHAGSVWSAV